MKKVMWFSRHTMSDDQKRALGDGIQITQVKCENLTSVWNYVNLDINGQNTTIRMADFVKDFDIIAIVAPIQLQKQFLDVSNGTPVIFAENIRTLIKEENGGEDKVVFNFGGWKQIKRIDVVVEDFVPST